MFFKRDYLKIAVVAALSAALLSSCVFAEPKDIVSEGLQLELSDVKEVIYQDNHEGFHGDGMTFAAVDCSENDAADQISENPDWESLPLDDTVKALVYGYEDDNIKVGPYLADEDGKPLIPEVTEGYYLLIDRQAVEDETTEVDILSRASFNFTLGIYDSGTDMLYYFELDT